ncbi:LysE family transporter [Alphaproteobacteria bacterium]|nr:LysE family transporter [Alphaproteobacteria bacterium]
MSITFDTLFYQAMLTGVLIAAPVGPVALMVMRYSLVQGTVAGLSMGVGTAIADTIMGVVVGLSMAFFADILSQVSFWIQLFGGICLIVWGTRNLLQHRLKTPDKNATALPYDSPWVIAPFAFILTIASPSTLLLFMTVYTTLAGPTITIEETASFSAGVFCGAFAWWILVSVTLGKARKRISKNWLLWISKASAIALIALGVLAVFYTLFLPNLMSTVQS